jgi:O-6-methylguanine DNA methyltransferase
MNAWTTVLPTWIGPLRIVIDGSGRLCEVRLPGDTGSVDAVESEEKCAHVTQQLGDYFAGTRQGFDLDLWYQGTAFQMAVWEGLVDIPFGASISNRELASRVGRPKAVRAVGGANGRNPIPIVVPCHRVIGASGELGGYSGGVAIKRALLEFEGALVNPGLFGR